MPLERIGVVVILEIRGWDESISGIFLIVQRDVENRLERNSGCINLGSDNTPPNLKHSQPTQ